MIPLVLAAALFLSAPTVKVHANLGGHGQGSFSGTYDVKNGRGDFLWTILFFNTGRASRADIQVGKSVLFPLCAPCTVGQSGRTNLTKRGMRLLESGQASVVVVGARGELRGRVVTRH
ncbi:MAG TPA: hypothetical protein VIL77_14000 [Gaiellaceae bacterium]